jgi:hypothetical protein
VKAATTSSPADRTHDGQQFARGERIDFVSIEVFVGWTMGRGDGRWRGGLVKVFEDALMDRSRPISGWASVPAGRSTCQVKKRQVDHDPYR